MFYSIFKYSIHSKVITKLIVITLLSFSPLFCQQILRISPPYVLIDTDKDLGKVGDELSVIRKISHTEIIMGSLIIVEFRKGKTAARIKDPKDFNMYREGDMVRSEQFPVNPMNFLFGIDAGVLYPYRMTADTYRVSPSFECFFEWQTNPFISLVFSLEAPLLMDKIVAFVNPSDYIKTQLYMTHIILRLYPVSRLSFDIGGGAYHFSYTSSIAGKKTHFLNRYSGFVAGSSIHLSNSKRYRLFVSLKNHTYFSKEERSSFATVSFGSSIVLN